MAKTHVQSCLGQEREELHTRIGRRSSSVQIQRHLDESVTYASRSALSKFESQMCPDSYAKVEPVRTAPIGSCQQAKATPRISAKFHPLTRCYSHASFSLKL